MATKIRNRNAQDDYLKLIKEFPLRRIKTDKENELALEVSEKLLLQGPEGSLSTGEEAYLDALGVLIREYESVRFPSSRSRTTPLARLRYIVQESGTSQAQLATILGIRQPAASLILSGKRGFTIDGLRRLAAHFKVSTDYFVG